MKGQSGIERVFGGPGKELDAENVLITRTSKLGMSFGVRFKVRTFGNKHPDGSNVRISFCRETDHSTCITYTFTCMLIQCSLERTFMTKSC